MSPICLFVSLKLNIVRTTARTETRPAIIKGVASETPIVKAEIAGPNTKPNPHDAPIMPKPLALSFSSVVSEITADKTGRLPAVIPSRARAINRNKALGAKAIIKKDKAVPPSEIIRRGLLPYLSDNLPIIGVERNWHNEKMEKSKPF